MTFNSTILPCKGKPKPYERRVPQSVRTPEMEKRFIIQCSQGNSVNQRKKKGYNIPSLPKFNFTEPKD